jgi:hypothetical protein
LQFTIRAAAGALALLAFACPTASATTESRVQDLLPVARAHWPDSPCAGREVVAVTRGLRTVQGDPAMGMAWVGDGGCRVEIRSGLTDYELCTVLVHELGHLAGQAHSDDPASPMYDGPDPALNEACDAATLHVLRLASARARVTRAVHGPGWLVRCRRLSRLHAMCSAVRERERREYSVWWDAGRAVIAGMVRGVNR